jgi:hypothetical protein
MEQKENFLVAKQNFSDKKGSGMNIVTKSNNSQEKETNSITPNQPCNSNLGNNVSEKVQALINDVRTFYYDHRLDQAYLSLSEIDKIIDVADSSNKKSLEEILEKEKLLIEQIRLEYLYMKKVVNELAESQDWKVEKATDSVNIFYKQIEGTQLITLKIEGEIDVPLLHLLTLIYEIDMWDQWVPFLKKPNELKHVHRAAKVVHIDIGLPFPLADRNAHIYGTGVNRLDENGTILIMARGIDEDQDFLGRHNITKVDQKKTVVFDLKFGAFEITPITKNRIKLRAIANGNPNFKLLPDSLLNWILRKAGTIIFNRISHLAHNFQGSKWQKATEKEEKKEFYSWLKTSLDLYFQDK